ncbi:MAG: hypothetical protein WB561_02355 [Terracidiphilus sp.]
MATQLDGFSLETTPPASALLLSDEQLAGILLLTTDWIRAHAQEIPGWDSGTERSCGAGCSHPHLKKLKAPQNVVPTFTEAQVKLLVK